MKAREKGTSLIEFMVAITIFSIGSLGAMAAFIASSEQVNATRLSSIAATKAREDIEKVLLLSYPDVASATDTVAASTLPNVNVSFDRTRTVTVDGTAGTKTVKVRMEWTDKRGPHSLTRTCVVTQ